MNKSRAISELMREYEGVAAEPALSIQCIILKLCKIEIILVEAFDSQSRLLYVKMTRNKYRQQDIDCQSPAQLQINDAFESMGTDITITPGAAKIILPIVKTEKGIHITLLQELLDMAQINKEDPILVSTAKQFVAKHPKA